MANSGQGSSSQPAINVIAPRSLFPQPSPAGYGQPPVRPISGAMPAPMGPQRPPLLLRPLLPRPQMPLPQRPLAGPVTLAVPTGPSLLPQIMPPKQTTLYVGKIASSVGDDIIKELLEACGPVKSWKRMEDPDTKALKPFGFCEFEEADGVIRALNLLQNMSVGGQELLLKCNSGTQKYIDEIEARKAREARQSGQDKSSKTVAEGAEDEEDEAKPDEPSSTELDNQALEKIMGIVSTLAQHLPAPPEATSAAEAFLSKLKEEEESKNKEEKHLSASRERHKGGRRETRDKQEERAAEASYQRERDAERKEAERKAHELDSAYKSALRKWEIHESDIRKAQLREKDHERDLAKERSRQCKADLEVDVNNDTLKPWQRKFYAGSRQASDRKRWRDKEQHNDDVDRKTEAEEVAKRAKLTVENGYGHDKRSPSASPATSVNPRLVDPNDSITQAMMNAAKAQRNPSKTEASPKLSPQPNNESQPSKPVRKPVLAAFGDDEEEDKPRQLKVINYSEEEQKAGQQVSARDAKDKPSTKEKANAIKALIAKVPTETKAVFSYNINWDAFDKGGEALSTKVRGWVATKTNQLLGVEEPSMIDFIMTQLQNHVSASKLLEEVEGVLDDEANPFVFKLYRMVIFESLKQEADLQD